ncbi:MAG TPA: hypothetical protein VGH76_13835 [Actinomycetospora sp.]
MGASGGPAVGRPTPPCGQPAPAPWTGPQALPAPRPAPHSGPQPVVPGHPYAVYGWDPADDVDDPRPAGNPAGAASVVLGVLAVLVSLRPLAFGSMAMAWDTYLALGVAVIALVLGGAGLRSRVHRPVAVVGMVLAVAALLVVAVLPTL